MARQFSDISPYRKAVSSAQGTSDVLNSLIQGIQGGVNLAKLPQNIQSQQIAQQLQNAINLQKLKDLQNPQAALARKLEEELTLKGALNPDLGIQRAPAGLTGETIAQPGAITPEQQAALTPSTTNIPTAPAAGLSETPISAFGIQTGLNTNPNIPIQAAENKLDRMIQLANAKPHNLILTKEGLAFDPRLGTAGNVMVGDQSVSEQRKTATETAAKTKNEAASALLDKKQGFTAEQNKLNRENQRTLADIRAESKAAGKIKDLTSKQKDEMGGYISSLKDLENLKSEIVDLNADSGEPGFWQNALAATAANPSTGFFSSAGRQLAMMGLNDSTIKKETARAGLEQAVKTALSGKTVSAGENLTLTGLLPKSDDTLAQLVIKLDGLETFLNNRIEGIQEAGTATRNSAPKTADRSAFAPRPTPIKILGIKKVQ